ETINIEIESEMKNLVVPYHLYSRISYELNNKDFIVMVLPNDKNLLKLGFQYTCKTTTTEIKSYLLAAIIVYY
ncbi:18948_t:CDS:1, partial [Racocetra persica]